MEEELNQDCLMENHMKNSFSTDTVSPIETKQEWWNEYLRYHQDQITKLFYGYSIDTTICPGCDFSTFTLSAFNTLYISLPLTHFKIHVCLVYQYMNSETGEISLSVRCIRVKVAKGSSIQTVLDSVSNRLIGTNCGIYSIIGNYETRTKHFGVSFAIESSTSIHL